MNKSIKLGVAGALLVCLLALIVYWKLIYVPPVIDLADPSLYTTGH